MRIPKIAVVNDLSGFGKCSLTTAIPILSAMGVQACPLPTGVLSNQTGFSSYACVDLTDQIIPFAAEWKKRGAQFDGIYTGFLCGIRQAELTAQFLADFRTPETLVLVDPVLGDDGHMYPALPPDLWGAVKALAMQADVITPNYTEACLLTGTPYGESSLERAWDMARQLAGEGPGLVAVSGVRDGGGVCTAVCEKATGDCFAVHNRWIGDHGYSGTGDILAAVLCGGLVSGMSAREALDLAARFLEASIAEAYADGTDRNEGVAFEHHLHLLIGKGTLQ